MYICTPNIRTPYCEKCFISVPPIPTVVAETGVFAISINDGYCEHTYTIKLKDELSIHKLMKKICKKLKVDMPDSKLRWVREFGN